MSAPNPSNQLTEGDVDNCPSVCEEASLLCVICLAAVHPHPMQLAPTKGELPNAIICPRSNPSSDSNP
jgi:hypothetical protein